MMLETDRELCPLVVPNLEQHPQTTPVFSPWAAVTGGANARPKKGQQRGLLFTPSGQSPHRKMLEPQTEF